MKKDLHLKKTLRTALLVLLLGAAGMGEGYSQDTFFVVSGPNSRCGLVCQINEDGNSVTVLDGTYEVYIPSTVTHNGKTYVVTKIGDWAFDPRNQFSLSLPPVSSVDLSVPNSIIEIGEGAFYNCPVVGSPYLNSVRTIGKKAFYGEYVDVNMDDLVIPDAISEIGDSTFFCRSFTSLTLGSSLTTIGKGAFAWVSSNSELVIPDQVIEIGEGAFRDSRFTGDLILPNSLTKIGRNAFSGCRFTGSLVLNDIMTTISDSLFYRCGFIGDLVIPNSVTEIGKFAFAHNNFTGSLIIGDSVTKIGRNAFSGCDGFTGSLIIGNAITPNMLDSITGYGNYCGYDIGNSFERIMVGSENPYLDSRDGCNAIIETNSNTLVYGCKNSMIPTTVTTIRSEAFFRCRDFTRNLVIPNSVTHVGGGAFDGCSFDTVYCYAETPPLDFGCYQDLLGDYLYYTLYVPCGCVPIYEALFYDWDGVTAILEDCEVYSIGISPTIAGGSVTVSASTAKPGEIIRLRSTPNLGFELLSFTVCNANDASQTVFVSNNSFVMPCFDVLVSAVFETRYFKINISSNIVGGRVTAPDSEVMVGDTVTLNVTPDPGYELQSLTVCNVDDANQLVYVFNNSFVMPQFNVLVSASFSQTSVEEADAVFTTVYPNPTNGVVSIKAEGLQRIEVYNTLGQLVESRQADGDIFECDLSRRVAGVYLVRMETAKGIATKRLVVTK